VGAHRIRISECSARTAKGASQCRSPGLRLCAPGHANRLFSVLGELSLMGSDPPPVVERVEEPAAPIAIGLIGRFQDRGHPRRQRRPVGRINIVDVHVVDARSGRERGAGLADHHQRVTDADVGMIGAAVAAHDLLPVLDPAEYLNKESQSADRRHRQRCTGSRCGTRLATGYRSSLLLSSERSASHVGLPATTSTLLERAIRCASTCCAFSTRNGTTP